MPLLAKLLVFCSTWVFGAITSLVAGAWGVRIIAAVTLAGIYLSCVIFYTTKVSEWIGDLFITQYGQLLGLCFPPVSGSVLAGMAAYYTCIVGKRYITTLTKIAVG